MNLLGRYRNNRSLIRGHTLITTYVPCTNVNVDIMHPLYAIYKLIYIAVIITNYKNTLIFHDKII